MSKYYAQEKRVFDINKITLVGSPTITTDGIATGFSSSNYLTGTSIDYSSLNSYEFHIKINSGDTPSDNSMFWGVQRVLYLYQNPNGRIYFTDASSGASLSFVADRNTDYDIICGHDENNLYYLKYKKVEEEDYTVSSATVNKRTTANGVLNIGCFGGGGFPLLTGSIDLGSIKVYANNQLVFSPTKPTYFLERRKEGFDLSKFTVVGTPTITEDGVASGFSGGNYIKIPKFDISKGFVIQEKFRCNSVVGSQTILSYTVGETNNTRFGVIAYFENNGKLSVNTTSNGTSFAGTITSLTTILPNVDYILKLEYDGTKIIMYLSSDNGITFIKEASKNIVLYNGLEVFKLGTGAVSTNTNSFNGSIALTQLSITVDGREVFTGAKEKFYAMRGGM